MGSVTDIKSYLGLGDGVVYEAEDGTTVMLDVSETPGQPVKLLSAPDKDDQDVVRGLIGAILRDYPDYPLQLTCMHEFQSFYAEFGFVKVDGVNGDGTQVRMVRPLTSE